MCPRVIVYNSVSLDGSIKDFELDIGLHYEIADKLRADAHLIGSETAKTGVELFMEKVPEEEPADFNRPNVKEGDPRPYWVIADAKGKLKGLLHVYRRSCYCKDVVVIVTSRTPEDYLTYLNERNYNVISSGEDTIDFHEALSKLSYNFKIRTLLTDSGGGLNSALITQGLVDEITLLISPVIVGSGATNLFRHLDYRVNLELIRSEVIRGNHLLAVYRVLTNINALTPMNMDREHSQEQNR
jgi:2,5-diamino-6-(ribosylamino)-4(3H)-pyrimidinone 5'-phosphate reductase